MSSFFANQSVRTKFSTVMDMSVSPSDKASYDMVIKKDFAKYIIDNKANLIKNDDYHDKARYIYAPALKCNFCDLENSFKNRFLLKAESRPVSKLFVKLDVLVLQDNRKVPFSILFESSLIQFLPGDLVSYEKLYASFASTSVDNFLFLHFQDSNFQIRTLLCSRENDIDRLFKEKTFFAIQKPYPQKWIENLKFEINLSFQCSVRESRYPMSEVYTVSVVKERPALQFEKENYHILLLEVNFVGFSKNYFLYFHESDLVVRKNLLSPLQESNSARRGLVCVKTNTGLSIEDPSVSVVLAEVTSLEELPRRMLVCSSFIIEEETDQTMKTQGFNISNNSESSGVMSSEPEPVLNPLTLSCPFPNCRGELAPSSEAVIQHFLSHPDFQRVIENQLKRHQTKNSKPSNQCPFERCEFQSEAWSDLEKHYGAFHQVGHIVFLQFSRANSWDTESFSREGIITQHVVTLVQCSHCFEVMTRIKLAIHVRALRASNPAK